ncbi:RNA degradosome polyphosphate kinase [Enterocloster lavalensis]|uniref:RNA degradosome polyphosphate kinase n=1 Tax=Enterocloster lavalensis TaxID=460384 RepID=UPI0026B562E0|nr:RNA degradosome polyphosphate kinase [Enterocloster lavalensis]
MADAEKTKSSKASKAKAVDAAGKKAVPEAGAEHRAAETPDVEENPQVEREMDGKAVGKPEAKKKAADKPEAKKKAGDKPEAKKEAPGKPEAKKEAAGKPEAKKEAPGKPEAAKKAAPKPAAVKKAAAKSGGQKKPAVAEEPAQELDFGANPDNYVNRELSWLEFNYRVLSEARDKTLPLFERLKFLSITASNLDEFYMVRVASLKDMVHAKYMKPDIAGMTPTRQLEAIAERTHQLVDLQYSTYNRSLLPVLRMNGLRVITEHEDLTEDEAYYVDRYFNENVYPVLTPMAFDSSRPFPLIRNKTLNIAALLRKKNGEEDDELDFAMVQVPSVIPRIVELPEEKDEEGNPQRVVILLEEIIERNMPSLFLNYDIIASQPFRVMRNADLTIDEEEAVDLLEEIQKQLKKRQWGEAIRLEIQAGVDKRLLKILKKELSINSQDIFDINGPLDLTFLMKMYGLRGFDHLKAPGYTPKPVPALMNEDDIFTNIRKGDILLHHPYQSFDPVVRFVRSAARDPEVLAIKQTLYRVSGNSPIVAALAEAADNGKQVSVLVELKARFDEENNINWAKKLEKAGCHVIYGLVGLKTHSKITLVVRMEEDGIRRYVHLGTGNYNDSTAKLYTDCGILTCSPQIGEDATAVFNMLSGYSEPLAWNRLSVAPLWLRARCLRMIRRETENALAGREAHIMAKMNSLCDKEIITALYEASHAGVKVELVIRGICCLRAGVPGLSENISVRSIVGNFLEHSRILYFYNDGSEELYMGSADWMPRNLDRRVEIMFPVEDEALKAKVIHILEVELADNVKAHILQPDGTYEKVDKRGKVLVNSQQQFCEEATAEAKAVFEAMDPAVTRIFKPIESSN